MEFIEEILTYLQTNSIGTKGVDLFRGTLPDDPDNSIMVIATGGTQPSTYLPIRDRSIQVTVRATSYEWAESKINAVYALLHNMTDDQEFVPDGMDVMQVRALQEPTNIGKDENQRTIYTCNFMVKTRTV